MPPAARPLPISRRGRRLVGSARVVELAVELVALGALAGCGGDVAPSAFGAPLDPQLFLSGEEARLLLPRPALLPRWEPERAAEVFQFHHSPGLEHDWISYFRREPDKSRNLHWPEAASGKLPMATNHVGLREDGPLTAGPYDLRVLVLGDSHTDGVVPNAESYANLLEARLRDARPAERIDVVNAGTGLYSFANYLGSLLKFLPLEPQVVIVGVYGGNDFGEVLRSWHAVQGTELPSRPAGYYERMRLVQQLEVGLCTGGESLAQGFNQLIYFKHAPEQREVALQASLAYLAELENICAARGAQLLLLYIPPPGDTEPERFAAIHGPCATAAKLDPQDLTLTDRLADEFLAAAAARGTRLLDGRIVLRGQSEAMFWQDDQHLNGAAHARLAAALFEALEGSSR
jgi:lysophospholipase L1-like esterase